ncbi:ATP-binding protein [Cellulophaga sp. 20_2_10]|uniref:ATP-binding protein n=1 Tax=Cellulophaga sp. 20_2_10 TaxID=2942476 RepID=UPI00201A5D05|nr:ATP-binding protein [Cellulophaga sp. 20_2_10]MCL5244215.1 ATP-binding protein [Cellulophaga sp. 20_2_10]
MNNQPYSNITFILVFLFLFTQLSYSQAKVDSIRKLVVAAEKQVETKDQKEYYIDLLVYLASHYQYENIDSLKVIADKALKLSKTISYDKGISDALSILSYYSSYQGNSDLALRQLKQALQKAKKVGEKNLQIDILNQIGTEYSYIGQNGDALKAYLKATDLAIESNNIETLSLIKDNTASLYASQKDYKQSLEIYKEVEALNKKINHPLFTAETNANISDIYIKTNQLDIATEYLDFSIKAFEKVNDKGWLSYCYINKARILIKQNEPKLALKWLDISEDILKELTDDRTLISLYNTKAKAYLSLNNINKAESFAWKSIELSNRLSLLEETEDSYNTLYLTYKKSGETELALKNLEKYKSISDSILKKENTNSLGALKTRTEYEREKKEAEALVKKELEKHQNYLYASIIASAILIFILLLIKVQANTRKKLYKQLIEQTNILKKREAELETINKTKDKLFSIIGHDLRNPIAALQSLLDMFVSKDVEAEDFLSFIPKLKGDVDALFFTLTNLLSWSKTQMNGGSTTPTLTNLFKIAKENTNLLAELAEFKNISIINNMDTKVFVWADENQMSVVIRNLLSNAIKFTKQNGTITISSKETKTNWIVIIKDTGIGIKPSLLDNLFSYDNSIAVSYGTNNEKGTGLGLPLCKEMITNNKGTIWAESTLEKGTSFYFTIPKDNEYYENLN